MKKYSTENIRNIGFFGHGSTGKTVLTEAILYDQKVIDRFGSISKGNTTSDFDPDEINRGFSIYTTTIPVEYKDTKLNILDTPGFLDFVGQVKSALRVVESGIFVVSANSGVEVGLERVWNMSLDQKMARAFFINKMDKENADFFKCLDEINETLRTESAVVPFQLPIGSAEKFTGIVDLVEKCSYTYEDNKAVKGDIPASMKDQVDEYYEKLAEAAAGDNEELMEKFFEGELTPEDIQKSLLKGVAEGKVTPVLCGAAEKSMGISNFLDFLVNYLPNPSTHEETVKKPGSEDEFVVKTNSKDPFAALVFKTTTDPYVGKLSVLKIYSGTLKADMEVYNPDKDVIEKIGSLMVFTGKNHEVVTEAFAGDMVTIAKLSVTATGDTLCAKERPLVFKGIDFPPPLMSLAVYPKSKGDEDKLGSSINKVLEEDPTFKVYRDPMTKETVISGIGELHLAITMDKLKRRFGLDVDLITPKIPYKETLKGKVQIEHKYKKQSGGRGQYGHVYIELEPLPKDVDFEFVDNIVGGVIPKNYIPSVEKGIKKAMQDGVIAGYPVVNVRARLFDGSYHTVDSSDMAFQIAGSMAFKKGALKANPVLLEPIMDVEVIVHESFMGDCIGDLNGKRGRIMGMDPLGNNMQSIKAQVPLAEMQRFSIDLRSITQGRGEYKMSLSHYEEVPAQIAEPIIAAANKPEE